MGMAIWSLQVVEMIKNKNHRYGHNKDDTTLKQAFYCVSSLSVHNVEVTS
jgi:hypothetical protein